VTSGAAYRGAPCGPAASRGGSIVRADAVTSDRVDASRRAESSDRQRRPGGGRCRPGADPGGGSRAVPSALIEPRLQEDRGGHAVDEFAPLFRGDATLAQPARRFDRRQALIDELDLSSRGVGERLGELARTPGLAPFLPLSIEGKTHQESVDPFGHCEPNELGDDPARLPAGQWGARMRHQAELVGHGQPHAYLPEINGRHTHPVAPTL